MDNWSCARLCQARPAAALILGEALSGIEQRPRRLRRRRRGFEGMLTSNVKALAIGGCGQTAPHGHEPSHLADWYVAARPLNPFGRARLSPLPAVPSNRRAAASPLARQRIFHGQQN